MLLYAISVKFSKDNFFVNKSLLNNIDIPDFVGTGIISFIYKF